MHRRRQSSIKFTTSNYDFYELVKYIRQERGAWDKTYQNGLGNREIISDKLIEETALS